ncbi:MAG: hypothetical protein WD577_12010 [Bacteroidales bacterium]
MKYNELFRLLKKDGWFIVRKMGSKKPSAAQTKRILQGVQQIGRELSEVRFLL